MTRRTWWTAGFLGITALAVGAELLAALDRDASTIPWTEYLTDLPWWVTMPAALTLSAWLPLHLARWYRLRQADRRFLMSVTPPDPNTSSTEPLVSVGTVTAAGTAVLSLAVALGLPVDDGQKAVILGFLAFAAPLVVALWGRRRVYSPASVAQLLTTRRQ